MDSRYEVIADNRRNVADLMKHFLVHQRIMNGSTDRHCGTV